MRNSDLQKTPDYQYYSRPCDLNHSPGGATTNSPGEHALSKHANPLLDDGIKGCPLQPNENKDSANSHPSTLSLLEHSSDKVFY